MNENTQNRELKCDGPVSYFKHSNPYRWDPKLVLNLLFPLLYLYIHVYICDRGKSFISKGITTY